MATADVVADVVEWMRWRLEREGCLYQDDVVDHMLRCGAEAQLKENADGNIAIGREVLAVFGRSTGDTVVWVKPDRYWRYRVPEDEPGREQRG